MAHYSFNQMGGSGGGHVNPNDLNFNSGGGFNSSSGFGDDELMDSLVSPNENVSGQTGGGQDFGMDMSGMNMGQYSAAGFNQNGMAMAQPQGMNGVYSSTPEGNPMMSPFQVQPSFETSYNQMQNGFTGLRAGSYGASPSARMPQAMQRKPSNTRSPLTKNGMMNGLPIGSQDSFGQPSPIRTNGTGHEKSLSGQYFQQNQTPNSMSSFPASGFSSPIGPTAFTHASHLNDVLLKGGTSMPAKLSSPTLNTSQEAKRRKRRESHNQVERRRRDNINERIQDLSKLVPIHRLEDEKIKKMIANGTPLSPTLSAIAEPASSGLAGPGARRAAAGAAGSAGNITTGLPIEEKDKGPNKGDILNGAVSWMRDLMWHNRLLLAHVEELESELGHRNYELSNEEERMTAELVHAMDRANEGDMGGFAYSRAHGSGLRVPDFTDYKGDPLDGNGANLAKLTAVPQMMSSMSPDEGMGAGMTGEYLDQDAGWALDDGDLDLKEEAEDQFMDLNQ